MLLPVPDYPCGKSGKCHGCRTFSLKNLSAFDHEARGLAAAVTLYCCSSTGHTTAALPVWIGKDSHKSNSLD